jgi:hypothetical protein
MGLIIDSKIDGEFRAYQLAEPAGQAFVAVLDHCQLVSFGAKLRTHLEDIAWAVLSAETAPLAPLPIDKYVCQGFGRMVMIERCAP